jgi:hypothetical protein
VSILPLSGSASQSAEDGTGFEPRLRMHRAYPRDDRAEHHAETEHRVSVWTDLHPLGSGRRDGAGRDEKESPASAAGLPQRGSRPTPGRAAGRDPTSALNDCDLRQLAERIERIGDGDTFDKIPRPRVRGTGGRASRPLWTAPSYSPASNAARPAVVPSMVRCRELPQSRGRPHRRCPPKACRLAGGDGRHAAESQ